MRNGEAGNRGYGFPASCSPRGRPSTHQDSGTSVVPRWSFSEEENGRS